ncbi:17069_t:CDS:1, partial [Gigaspora rosea]
MSAPPTPYYIKNCELAPTYLSGSEDSELTPTYTGRSNRHEDCELIPTYQSKLEVNEVSQASSSKVVST